MWLSHLGFVAHAVDTLSTGCQSVSVVYRIPYAFVIKAEHSYEINSLHGSIA